MPSVVSSTLHFDPLENVHDYATETGSIGFQYRFTQNFVHHEILANNKTYNNENLIINNNRSVELLQQLTYAGFYYRSFCAT